MAKNDPIFDTLPKPKKKKKKKCRNPTCPHMAKGMDKNRAGVFSRGLCSTCYNRYKDGFPMDMVLGQRLTAAQKKAAPRIRKQRGFED